MSCAGSWQVSWEIVFASAGRTDGQPKKTRCLQPRPVSARRHKNVRRMAELTYLLMEIRYIVNFYDFGNRFLRKKKKTQTDFWDLSEKIDSALVPVRSSSLKQGVIGLSSPSIKAEMAWLPPKHALSLKVCVRTRTKVCNFRVWLWFSLKPYNGSCFSNMSKYFLCFLSLVEELQVEIS